MGSRHRVVDKRKKYAERLKGGNQFNVSLSYDHSLSHICLSVYCTKSIVIVTKIHVKILVKISVFESL